MFFRVPLSGFKCKTLYGVESEKKSWREVKTGENGSVVRGQRSGAFWRGPRSSGGGGKVSSGSVSSGQCLGGT